MENLELIKKIAPEIVKTLEMRYSILRSVSYNQPIGRRMLSEDLRIKERTIRDEANILKEQGLLNIDFMGMNITEEGTRILENLQLVYTKLKGIPKLEERLQDLLGIKKVVIVPGNSNYYGMVLGDMGKITSRIIKSEICENDIIGITGGNTMAAVAEEIVPDKVKRDITIIPARGGLGRNVETQANSIAAKLADKLGGAYRLLYVPDGLERDALEIMLRNDEIKESIDLINNMNILVFGLGRADTMANRRNLSPTKIEELIDRGAVAEAFGHYFDINGNEIWEYRTVGLSLDKFKSLNKVIGVAGGEEKAHAIISIATLNDNMILITDEPAANKILEIKAIK
ncbi:MAG: sugar-binding transcriptional regulator [Tissierellaceae bacterium]|nr:sugar-binding transcriptional regulator [Tissierellaceae bacterium]